MILVVVIVVIGVTTQVVGILSSVIIYLQYDTRSVAAIYHRNARAAQLVLLRLPERPRATLDLCCGPCAKYLRIFFHWFSFSPLLLISKGEWKRGASLGASQLLPARRHAALPENVEERRRSQARVRRAVFQQPHSSDLQLILEGKKLEKVRDQHKKKKRKLHTTMNSVAALGGGHVVGSRKGAGRALRGVRYPANRRSPVAVTRAVISGGEKMPHRSRSLTRFSTTRPFSRLHLAFFFFFFSLRISRLDPPPDASRRAAHSQRTHRPRRDTVSRHRILPIPCLTSSHVRRAHREPVRGCGARGSHPHQSLRAMGGGRQARGHHPRVASGARVMPPPPSHPPLSASPPALRRGIPLCL